MRVILISVDGMRPDAIADMPRAKRVMAESASSLNGRTVYPSWTLPCHMSMFHSVDPGRHGVVTNTYTPQVRPIPGICEVLAAAKKECAFFYNWEELRDLSRPDSLQFAYFRKGRDIGYDKGNRIVTDAAIDYLNNNHTDFAFLYLGYTDMNGHRFGWMSKEYMDAMENSWECIEKLIANLPEDYVFIITTDHGGHDRTHGTDLPEDMITPIVIRGKGFEPGSVIPTFSIKDIPPTVVSILGVEPDEEWEGKSLYQPQ